MDYPRRSLSGRSLTYKKKRLIWFNSTYNDDFSLVDGKITDITFNISPFQLYKNNDMKVISFIHENKNAKPTIIKLKEPFLNYDTTFNSDKEASPIIYVNHTGHEGMTSQSPSFNLTSQQIQRFVFKLDESFTSRNGATANETLIQTTNSSIVIDENSKYQINYQQPINIQKGTYEAIFQKGNIYLNNKNFPRPWGAYFAEDWSGTTLLDSSGNGRHATTSGTIYSCNLSGNGANAAINYLVGGTTSTITWPSGSIPSTFTILSLTRYNNASANQQRILQASTLNFAHGHINTTGLNDINSTRGVCFYGDTYKTNSAATSSATKLNWLCTIGKNSGSIPGNILLDGVASGTESGGTGNNILTLNTGFSSSQSSDFAFSCVLIWDSALTNAQMVQLNSLVENYKQTGISFKNDIWLNNDYSYPIIKRNDQTLNPIAWYRFDNNNLTLDSSGNLNTLTTNNGTFENNIYVKGNGGIRFTRSSSQFATIPFIPFNTYYSAGGFSISLWTYVISSVANAWQRIFCFFANGPENNNSYIALIQSPSNIAGPNRLYVEINDNVNSSYSQTIVEASSLLQWFHLVIVISSTRFVTLYRNGVLVSSIQMVGGIATYTSSSVANYISRGTGASVQETMDGYVDDFRIYDQVLTAAEVSELYNGRIAIYNPPNFQLCLEMEDKTLIKDNIASIYR